MTAKSTEKTGGGRAGGSGGYVEPDPALVRARSDQRGADRSTDSLAENVDPQTDWRETEHLPEPILLQAQRLLEAAGSLERAIVTLERAAEREDV